MLCKRWRNTNDELVPGSFIFVPGFRDKKYQSKTKRGHRLIKSVILFNGSNASTSVTYEVCCLSIFERENLKPGQVFSSTILTFDTLNRGRTVFFNGGNDDNFFCVIFTPNCLPLSSE
jgi:hypothetical protein